MSKICGLDIVMNERALLIICPECVGGGGGLN